MTVANSHRLLASPSVGAGERVLGELSESEFSTQGALTAASRLIVNVAESESFSVVEYFSLKAEPT